MVTVTVVTSQGDDTLRHVEDYEVEEDGTLTVDYENLAGDKVASIYAKGFWLKAEAVENEQ